MAARAATASASVSCRSLCGIGAQTRTGALRHPPTNIQRCVLGHSETGLRVSSWRSFVLAHHVRLERPKAQAPQIPAHFQQSRRYGKVHRGTKHGDREDDLVDDLHEETKYKFDSQGRIVLYRGPPAMKTWLYYFIGCTFVIVGLEASYNIYNHFSLPLFGGRDPQQKPVLVEKNKRIAAAGVVGAIGLVTGCLFFMVPSASVTRISLDVPKRQLVIRTAVRGFSALPPRWMYPSALRKTAEVRGYYCTPQNNERVVPLSYVFRIRGSAQGAIAQPSVTLRPSLPSASQSVKHSTKDLQKQKERQAAMQRHEDMIMEAAKRSVEVRVGNDRFWYTAEVSGGRRPSKTSTPRAYARFFKRLSYWMRGRTDWSDVDNPPTRANDFESSMLSMDAKEPWFLSRRMFDDMIPLVRRK